MRSPDLRSLWGFRAGVSVRVAIAVVLSLVFALAIILVETRRATASQRFATAPTATVPMETSHWQIEATFPVTEWVVMVNGDPLQFDAQEQSATFVIEGTTAPTSELFVEARNEDPLSEASEALRLFRLTDDGPEMEHSTWGTGDLSLLVLLRPEAAIR